MGKLIYIVRHCEATGQAENAELTDEGNRQADDLVKFFKNIQIDHIISSPFVRAQETIKPLANKRDLSIKLDERLGERVLSTENLLDWQEKLQATFIDPYLTFPRGESSSQAAERIKQVVDELAEDTRTMIVTHGNIMSLLLREFDNHIGYNEWKALTNPDVYKLEIKGVQATLTRLWKTD